MSLQLSLAPVFLVACLSAPGAVLAQTAPAGAAAATPVPAAAATGTRSDQRIEHIRVEDAGSRIDELRVGGETQSITVVPKGGMPAYDVLPSGSSQSLAHGQRNSSAASGGNRVWKILGFLSTFMAVYTEVSFDEASTFVDTLDLGPLHSLEGAAGGIENTNYFISTERGQFVLTLFERLSFAQLPFYLALMKHLAQRGIPVPDPAEDRGGIYLHTLKGKPATIVNRLAGSSAMSPTREHCTAVGNMLARMHLATRDFPLQQPNLRGLDWWNETVPAVLPFLDAQQAALIRGELAYQNHVCACAAYAALPRGAIHADLFRDNVLFDSDSDGSHAAGAPRLTGFFDFYFAGVDCWLFDVAVCLNDWCVDLQTGRHDAPRAQAMLEAYAAQRPLTGPERALLPAMARAGALRFWISRLWDLHLPRAASMLKPHDPSHFERVLRQRVGDPVTISGKLENLAP